MSGPMTPSAAPDSLPLMRPAIFRGIGSVRAGFSTREGGASAAPYGSLNLGLSTADDPAAVAENRRRFFAALGATPEDAAIAGQVHGTDVLPVTSGGLYRRVDGLVTATPGVLLCMIAADCASVLFADPEARVVGACHAGWRGAVGGVAEETLRQMAPLGADAAQVTSPTFAIAHTYATPRGRVHHVDAYRIERPADFAEIGGETYLDDLAAVVVVEWPSRIAAALPAETVIVWIEHDGETARRFTRLSALPANE